MSRFPRPGRTPRPRPVPTAGPTPSPTPGPGTTFTLTTRSDTATANVFNGPTEIVGNFALNTLNNGDRLTGVGVNPTLDVQLNINGGAAITPAELNNIQTLKASFINLGAGAAGPVNLNIGNGTGGFQAVELNSPLSAVNINSIGTALNNIAISNVDLSGNAQTFNFSDAALAGPSNAVTVTLNNVGNSTTSEIGTANSIGLNTTSGGSNYETVNVVSVGQANNASFVQNGTGDYRTLNVSGAANFTTTNTSNNLTAFNASAATGAVTYVETQTVNAAYLGGTGNTTINLSNGSYTTADTVNGGAGGVDVLALNGAALTAATANQTNVSNINIVRLGVASTAAVTVTPAFFGGASTFALGADISGASTSLTTNFSSGVGNVNFSTFDASGAFTAVAAGTATTDVLNLAAANAAGNVVSGATTLTGYETVNIASTGAANTQFGSTFTVAPSIGGVGSVNVAGSSGATFNGTVTGVSLLNASAITGGSLQLSSNGAAASINITGSNFADTLVGSSASDVISGLAGNDRIDGNGGGDQLLGGAGFDTFFFDVSSAGSTTLSNTSIIGDFVVGTASATDIFALDASTGTGLGLEDTSGNNLNDSSVPNILSFSPNTSLDLSGNAQAFNFIKVTGGATTTATTTAQQGFAAAIGAGSINVTGGVTNVAASYYDATNNQAVFGVLTAVGSTINSADTFNVTSRISLSAADYAAFGGAIIDFV